MEVQLVILVLELFILHGSAGLTLNSPVISPSVPQTVEPLRPSTSLSPPKVPPPDKSVLVPLMPLTPPTVAPIDNSPPLTPTVQKPLPHTPPPVSHERTSDAHSPITVPHVQVPIASPPKMVPVIPLPERSSTPGVAPIISDHVSPISVPPPNTSRKDNGVPIVSPPYKSADAPKTSEVLVPSVPPSSLMIPPVNTSVLVPPSSISPPMASPTIKSAPIVSTPYKSADAPESSEVLPSVPPSPLMIPPINTSVLVPPSSIDPPVASSTIKPAPSVSTPYKSADAPKSSEVLVPSVPPSPLMIAPINTSVLVPPSSINPPMVSPTVKSAPFISIPSKSADAPKTSEVLRPLMISPIDTSVLVPSTSINPPVISPTIKPAPRIKTPELVPPTPQTISPEKALGDGHLIPVSHPQVPIAPPPRKLPERPLPVHPPALGVTPTVSDHVPPTSVPPARISKKEHGIPVAAPPPKETPNSWSPPPVQEHAVSPASTPPTSSMKDHGLPFAAPPPEISHYLSPMNQPPIKEHEVSPISNPPPSTSKKEYRIPIASPPKKTFHQISPKSHSTTKGHAMSPKSAPPPIIGKKEYTTPVAAPPKQTHDKLSPMSHPPQKVSSSSSSPRSDSPSNAVPAPPNLSPNHEKSPTNPGAPRPPRLPKKHRFTPLAPSYPPTVPPKKSRPRHHSPPTSFPGFISPTQPPLPAADARESPAPAPSPSTIISSSQTKKHVPRPPMISPLASPPRKQKMPLPPPVRALPPPPPNKDCASLTCSEPTTNSPPGAPCACVIPIKVELRLGVALYTFFPLVSELAVEIASGVFMKQSQVRIMGANAATQQLEKTDVLIDLVPLGDKFDNTTALLTFQRFWQKQIVIRPNFFGDYQVLYVTYPGLPPSPPFADSSITIIDGVPYIDPGNNARTMHPLGVDVPKGKKRGLAGSIIAIIVLSSFAVLVLCIGAAWLLAVKCGNHTQVIAKTPRTSVPSLAKQSAGGARSTLFGSGISSASLSFGSSITAYAGTAKTFSADEIERATDNYSESRILGEGGFGVVYKGILDDGKEVAVKVLKRDDQQGGREFLAEVEMLSRLHHRNLVKLIGICIEDHSHSLVYELIPNGSVESHLHGVHKETAPLDWASRMKIALGSARGLAYLHEDSSPHVIHRDFKSSNILLEDDFTPKVSDFGLARSALEEGSNHISTRVMGTFGYVAPEYAMTGHLLVKSDVYSYGVVLLELLTGRKPVDMSQPEGQENLVAWARPLLTSREGLEIIIDPALGSRYTFDNVAKVAAIASMCVQPEVTHRPFMGEVVQALKLVCEETTEVEGSESSIVDIDTNKASGSGRLLGSERGHYSDYDSSPENDGGLSASDMFSSNSRFGRHQQMSGSFRRHSSSGPLRPGRTRQFWKRVKGVSSGSVSEHGFAYRLWGES